MSCRYVEALIVCHPHLVVVTYTLGLCISQGHLFHCSGAFQTVSASKIYYAMYNKLTQDIRHLVENNGQATKQHFDVEGGMD